jgi:hypothetical protein
MATRGEPRHERQTRVHQLRCVQCGCASGLYATGSRCYRTDDPEQREEPELGFFCPACAEREFGPLQRRSPLEERE